MPLASLLFLLFSSCFSLLQSCSLFTIKNSRYFPFLLSMTRTSSTLLFSLHSPSSIWSSRTLLSFCIPSILFSSPRSFFPTTIPPSALYLCLYLTITIPFFIMGIDSCSSSSLGLLILHQYNDAISFLFLLFIYIYSFIEFLLVQHIIEHYSCISSVLMLISSNMDSLCLRVCPVFYCCDYSSLLEVFASSLFSWIDSISPSLSHAYISFSSSPWPSQRHSFSLLMIPIFWPTPTSSSYSFCTR